MVEAPTSKATWGSLSSVRGARTGAQVRSLGAGTQQKSWVGAAYWLAPHALFSVLSDSTQDHLPQCGTAHSYLDPPTSSSTKNMLHRPTCRPVEWKLFSIEDSSLRQSDRKLASTLEYLLSSTANTSCLLCRTLDSEALMFSN